MIRMLCWTWADHVLEWFDQGVAAGPDIRAFEYRKPRVRINVSSSTLVHNDVHCARVPAHSDPRFLLIHLGTVGLFVEEVQTISQLGVRDVGAEDGHRPELPKRLKPTVVVVHPVDRSPATIWCTRRRHNDDADFVGAPVMPECCLFLRSGEVGAADDVEVAPAGGYAAPQEDYGRTTLSAANLANIVAVRQPISIHGKFL